MSNIFWNSSLEVGIPKIDEQHKMLVNKISDLLELSKNPITNGMKIKEMIFFLEEYVKSHFATEEAFMRVKKYDYMDQHLREHKFFTIEFLKLKENYLKNGITLEIKLKLNSLLVDWLINHISKVDKKLKVIA